MLKLLVCVVSCVFLAVSLAGNIHINNHKNSWGKHTEIVSFEEDGSYTRYELSETCIGGNMRVVTNTIDGVTVVRGSSYEKPSKSFKVSGVLTVWLLIVLGASLMQLRRGALKDRLIFVGVLILLLYSKYNTESLIHTDYVREYTLEGSSQHVSEYLKDLLSSTSLQIPQFNQKYANVHVVWMDSPELEYTESNRPLFQVNNYLTTHTEVIIYPYLSSVALFLLSYVWRREKELVIT